MTSSIEIVGLTKRFGDELALDHLDLTIGKGSVCGFLGPNGAGKTTTQRLLVGLAKPTSGTARILGYDILTDMRKISKNIGFLPDVPVFYNWMTATEYLRFVGGVFKIPHSKLSSKIESLLELADLKGVKTKIGGYSRGMRQRLGVAQALINDAKVILMDEPTSALDPIGRKEVLDMIASLGSKITIFLSSHILTDVERVCDTVAIINKGRLLTEENLDSLKSKYVKPSFSIELAGDPTSLVNKLKVVPWMVSTNVSKDNVVAVVCKNLESGERELPRLIADLKLPLKNFQLTEPSLEDIFIEMVEER